MHPVYLHLGDCLQSGRCFCAPLIMIKYPKTVTKFPVKQDEEAISFLQQKSVINETRFSSSDLQHFIWIIIFWIWCFLFHEGECFGVQGGRVFYSYTQKINSEAYFMLTATVGLVGGGPPRPIRALGSRLSCWLWPGRISRHSFKSLVPHSERIEAWVCTAPSLSRRAAPRPWGRCMLIVSISPFSPGVRCFGWPHWDWVGYTCFLSHCYLSGGDRLILLPTASLHLSWLKTLNASYSV